MIAFFIIVSSCFTFVFFFCISVKKGKFIHFSLFFLNFDAQKNGNLQIRFPLPEGLSSCALSQVLLSVCISIHSIYSPYPMVGSFTNTWVRA